MVVELEVQSIINHLMLFACYKVPALFLISVLWKLVPGHWHDAMLPQRDCGAEGGSACATNFRRSSFDLGRLIKADIELANKFYFGRNVHCIRQGRVEGRKSGMRK